MGSAQQSRGVPSSLRTGPLPPAGTPGLVLDLDALDANADALAATAGPLPIRIASKSVRCLEVLQRVLRHPGFAGVLSYSLPEALWLASNGVDDVLLAYPTADTAAIEQLKNHPELRERITLMVDHPQHLDLLAGAGTPEAPVKVCLDVDASLVVGRLHLGVRRSCVHTVEEAVRAARGIAKMPSLRLRGVMFYDAQIAGMPDSSPAVRMMKRLSRRDLMRRRRETVAALRAICPSMDLVNVGGTGSLHTFGDDQVATEAAAGSGLYAPRLFDAYDDLDLTPSLYMVCTVARRPAPGVATVFSGGYIASGPPTESRTPVPVYPPGLKLIDTEGAGEVQTPVQGPTADDLAVGDRVWFRLSKAGEPLERFESLVAVSSGEQVGVWPTYRGEGRNFG